MPNVRFKKENFPKMLKKQGLFNNFRAISKKKKSIFLSFQKNIYFHIFLFS